MKVSVWSIIALVGLGYAQQNAANLEKQQISCINPAAKTASGWGKCNSIISAFSSCNNIATTDKVAGASCVCRQEMFNGIYDCDNEMRFCDGFGDDEWIGLADSWHTACDTKISFTPTTPVRSSMSFKFDPNACTTPWQGCLSQSAEFSKCQSKHSTISSDLTSCLCQPPFLEAAFTCTYLGNVSCSLIPGTLSRVRGYADCPNFMSIVGPLVNATATASQGALSTLSASLSASRPAFPGSSVTPASTGPTAKSLASSAHISGRWISSGLLILAELALLW